MHTQVKRTMDKRILDKGRRPEQGTATSLDDKEVVDSNTVSNCI
jgi:hypothetical protein